MFRAIESEARGDPLALCNRMDAGRRKLVVHKRRGFEAARGN